MPTSAPARVRRASAPARPPASSRTPLRVVGPRPRPPASRRPLVLAVGTAIASLLAVGAAHAYLTEGQVRLAQLEQQLDTAQTQQRSMEVQVAELEAPGRVVAQADKDGLSSPKSVTDLPLVSSTDPGTAAGR